MSLTIAQINSGVFLGLGEPDGSVCDPMAIHYAVRSAVHLLTRQMRAADTNQPLSLSAEFTPTGSPHEITSLVAKGEVAWLERKEGSRWKTVRVVNKAFLENYHESRLPVAAIYSDETSKTYIDFSVVIDANSTQIYRLWFDKDVVLAAKASESLIPDSFAPYIELLAQNTCIARIKRNLAERIENEEERRIINLQLETWDGLLAQNSFEIRDWRVQWKRHIHRQRTAQTQDRLPNKSGRTFYGG